MDAKAAMLEEIISIVPGVENLPSLTLACLVWHAYDWIINFDREVEYIWKRRWTTGSVLYVLLRLYAVIFPAFDTATLIAPHVTSSLCVGFGWTSTITTGTQIMFIQILLQGRVFALYQGDKRLLYFNACFFLVAVAGTAISYWKELPRITGTPAPKPLVGCWLFTPRLMITGLIPPLALDAWLVFLVLRRAVQDFLWRRKHPRTTKEGFGKTVSSVVVRDYLLWFISAALAVLASILIFIYAPGAYNYSGVPLFHALNAIGACRMVLNVREAYHKVHVSDSRPTTTAVISTGIGVFALQTRNTVITRPEDVENDARGEEYTSDDDGLPEGMGRDDISEQEKAYIHDL